MQRVTILPYDTSSLVTKSEWMAFSKTIGYLRNERKIIGEDPLNGLRVNLRKPVVKKEFTRKLKVCLGDAFVYKFLKRMQTQGL